MARTLRLCDKCGLACIPKLHKCGTTAYCGTCFMKAQHDKKPYGEKEYEVGEYKAAKCKVCKKAIGIRK